MLPKIFEQRKSDRRAVALLAICPNTAWGIKTDSSPPYDDSRTNLISHNRQADLRTESTASASAPFALGSCARRGGLLIAKCASINYLC